MTSSLRSPAAVPPQPPEMNLPSRTGERILARRPALPGGRAVVGALLIVSAGIGTFAVATRGNDGPTTAYPVLVRAVDPGQAITDGDVEWRAMELDPLVAARTFGDPTELAEAVALAPLAEGELVQRGQVSVDPDSAKGAGGQISIPVPVDRTPPGLRRGERVAVLATYGSGSDATTIITVESATVLSHDTRSEAIGSSASSRLTLAVDDPAAVIATAHAAQVAELTIVRTSGTSSPLPGTYRRDAIERSAPSMSDDESHLDDSERHDG